MADGFAAEMAALAQSIRQRDAENRAADKQFAGWRSTCAERAAMQQQRFLSWCSMELQTAVSQAAVALAPTGWKLTLTIQRPPSCRYLDESRTWIIGQAEIALARDLSQHTLTITLRTDGSVSFGCEEQARQEASDLSQAKAEEVIKRLAVSAEHLP